ncbi:hypothetical protein N7481_001167 [Penicillium waksmanii]|uniref:uncharacterized protein n=1 Tax=Penicillium waksmanii TaxID=69791 RepID=UPI0025498D2F|nr:uncharacterized protein N7481_001167 [Penicillium waksmanii]KAJ6000758.1 hypothetical protein N7481_001167 [Penicillium waksmanii]
MASIREATAPFRHTWKSLPDSCANFSCITENWNDWSERKTYLECDAQDLNGTWKKSRFYLDENVKAARGGMDYRVTPSYRSDTLSSNLVSPHPKVAMRNGKLDLTAHGQGPDGPIWRTVTLHDLMNEDGVVFSSGAGLSPKGLAVRLAWIEADKAKKEAEDLKRDAARKSLEPLFREEWLDRQNKEIKALEEMRRRLPDGFKDPFIDDRIKAIQTEIATTVPSMPESWSSKKLQQLSENEEKAKKEAERKEMELTWKKWKQYVLARDVERSKKSVKLYENDPRNLDIMKRNLRDSEARLAKFPMMTMPQGWTPDEEEKRDIERMEMEPIWREKKQNYFTFNIGQLKKVLKDLEQGGGNNTRERIQRELDDLEEQFAKLPGMSMPDGWRPA